LLLWGVLGGVGGGGGGGGGPPPPREGMNNEAFNNSR
jgi:hypothetical protein